MIYDIHISDITVTWNLTNASFSSGQKMMIAGSTCPLLQFNMFVAYDKNILIITLLLYSSAIRNNMFK